MNEIISVSNPRVKQWVKYHDKKHRDRDGLFLVEGEHLIQEAITAGLLTDVYKRQNMNSFKVCAGMRKILWSVPVPRSLCPLIN